MKTCTSRCLTLTKLGVNIEELHTEVLSAAMSVGQLFKVKAPPAVPEGLAADELKRELELL